MKPTQVVERIEVDPESLFYHEHAARYEFARMHVQPGLLLDLASGAGYGANQLCRNPGTRVVGVDIHLPSVGKAQKSYPDRRISFVASDGLSLPFENHCFQSVVSLETIEHVADDAGFLREVVRVLNPYGLCILSTPNRAYSARHSIVNPYHVREYSESELRELLQAFFAKVHIHYQGFADSFYAEVNRYATAIQTHKKTMPPLLQFAVNYIYRPVKRLVPEPLTNFFINRWLKLSYPAPHLTDITISGEPLQDTNVFVAVCQHPRDWQEPALRARLAKPRKKRNTS
ncbi:MAG: class I SAM-dependent methyltransferase [Chloroflexi bacterium]|nr:class I SAM-dependent methyltransferase [Chloroflexota bacterium]